MKRVVCVSVIDRPHLITPDCWCRPERLECTCGEGHGTVYRHRLLTLTCDVQPRMAVFSEQLPTRIGWGGR